ncbi:MAG: hypothetical protein QGI45_09625, partial [Myxococcota bacterium]|nr:hypothetical protein [Myxococcota bacterium]
MFGPENPSLNAEDGAPEEYLVDEFELSGCGVDESLEDVLGEEPWADEVRGGDGGGAARAPSLPGGLGPQRVLTLLLEAGGRRFSAAELAAIPHTVYGAQADEGVALPPYSVNEAFAADSYGQTTIVGIDGEPGDADDVFGPFQVDDYRCSSPMSAVNEALERYEDAFDPAVFADGARLLLIMRQNTETCRYGGVATGGTMRSPDLPEGLLHMRLAVALYPGHRVIAHELGHIMGMGHTGITQCSGAAWGDIPYRNNTNAYYGDATCGSRTYADWMGFMGLGGASFMSHSGAIAKEAWGWLREDEDATHHIAPVNESGLYALKSISHTDVAGTKALKIPHGPNQFMYVEYRRAMEHDGTPTIDKNVAESAFYEESDIFSGALLRIGGGNGMYRRSLLFDAYASEDDLDLRT